MPETTGPTTGPPPLNTRRWILLGGAATLLAGCAQAKPSSATLLRQMQGQSGQSTVPTPTGGNGVVDVRSFGAAGDGAHDDGPAIQRALDAAGPHRQTVLLPGGTYLVGETLKIPEGVSVSGYGATITATGAIAVLTVAGPSASVRGLTIQGQRTPGQTAIAVAQPEFHAEDISISLVDTGIAVGGGFFTYWERLTFRNIRSVAIDLSGGNDHYFNFITHDTDVAAYKAAHSYPEPTVAGVNITGAQAVVMSNADFVHAGTGMQIAPDGQQLSWSHLFSNIFLDTCGTDGLVISPTTSSGVRVQDVLFSNCWFSTSGGRGVAIEGSTVHGVMFTGCNAHNNAADGFSVSGAGHIRFVGCTAVGNNRGNTGASGFSIAGYEILVQGCYAGMWGIWTSRQQYNVDISAVAANVSVQGGSVDQSQFGASPVRVALTASGVTVAGVQGYNPVGPLTPPAIPLASGQEYRNTSGSALTLYQPVYASGSGTQSGGRVDVYLGSASSLQRVFSQRIDAHTGPGSPEVVTLRIAPDSRYRLDVTGATLLPAQMMGD